MGRMPSRSRRIPTHLSTCRASGKVRYPDSKAAVAALYLAALGRQRAESAGLESHRQEKRHYECSACSGWHLTSQAVDCRLNLTA